MFTYITINFDVLICANVAREECRKSQEVDLELNMEGLIPCLTMNQRESTLRLSTDILATAHAHLLSEKSASV